MLFLKIRHILTIKIKLFYLFYKNILYLSSTNLINLLYFYKKKDILSTPKRMLKKEQSDFLSDRPFSEK